MNKKKKLVLVAMPWPPFDSASPAIATLSAYIARECPDWEVECRSEYISLWVEIQDEYVRVMKEALLSEFIYIEKLYPENRTKIIECINEYSEDKIEREKREGVFDERQKITTFTLEKIIDATTKHLQIISAQISVNCDVLGMTVSSVGQFFASLCLAKYVKEQNKNIINILGGPGVGSSCSAIIDKNPFIDYIVQGEGEVRLKKILDSIGNGVYLESKTSGIHCHSKEFAKIDCKNEFEELDIQNLDTLPIPDYSEYYGLADKYNIHWTIPVEGSRGCWWDRRHKLQDPFKVCFFCGLNESKKRREKSVTYITSEIDIQSKMYQNPRFRFLDNVVSHGSINRLTNILNKHKKDYRYFVEARANISYGQLIKLKESGCASVQIGIEGFSTRYLERLNKGTTTIQNLQAMRDCYELEIRSISNIIIGFPGATRDEVEESVENISRYSICYHPVEISKYSIDINSVVYRYPEKFGIKRIMNRKWFRNMLPETVEESIMLPWLDYETNDPQVDWANVIKACVEWREFYNSIKGRNSYNGIEKALFYFDGSDFLEIIDRRSGFKTITLDKIFRDIYLMCTSIQSYYKIKEKYGDKYSEHQIKDALESLIKEGLIFRENDMYLSLAVAWRPDAAIRRYTTNKSV